jgi:outer membrane lipoprotein carrier protein
MQQVRLVLFALAASLLSNGAPGADRLDEILAEMDQAGKRLKTMTADFVQTDHDFLLKDEEETRGKLYLSVPGRIRWEHAPPREKVLLVKDDLVRVYNPTARQVQEFRRGKGSKSGGADLLIGFGGGSDKIGESYDASLVEETATSATLALVPKPSNQSSIFVKIEITLDKKSWTPVRSVFHSPNKNRADIQFQNVVLNGVLPKDIFELKLPPGVEIIRN